MIGKVSENQYVLGKSLRKLRKTNNPIPNQHKPLKKAKQVNKRETLVRKQQKKTATHETQQQEPFSQKNEKESRQQNRNI